MSKSHRAVGKSKVVNVGPPVKPEFVSQSMTLNMQIEVYPYDASAADAKLTAMLADASAGKPLNRSKTGNNLAEQASQLRGRKPSDAKEWASGLARSLIGPAD
jgi:hypothetical protein